MPAKPMNFDVIIYHNPQCGKSRAVLSTLREAGIEPHVVEYLKTPPSTKLLKQLLKRMGAGARTILRDKGSAYTELRLDRADIPDDEILAAIEQYPALLNRPIVVTPLGVRLCRPPEVVQEILPAVGKG